MSLSLIFKRIGIDTEEVLRAAGTKWNFLPFRPGLVGGHCIGVDPYYLTHKATEIGYHPEMILAGRRINDGMGAYVAQQIVKLMADRRIMVADSKMLILGLAFKENCPDLRNSKVMDVVNELQALRCQGRRLRSLGRRRRGLSRIWTSPDQDAQARPLRCHRARRRARRIQGHGRAQNPPLGEKNTCAVRRQIRCLPGDQTDGRL